jgi:hypothetical protein
VARRHWRRRVRCTGRRRAARYGRQKTLRFDELVYTS